MPLTLYLFARNQSYDSLSMDRAKFIVISQFIRHDVGVPGAVDLRAGPNLGLVRLSSGMPTLEREEETEANRRTERFDSFVKRHPGRVGRKPPRRPAS